MGVRSGMQKNPFKWGGMPKSGGNYKRGVMGNVWKGKMLCKKIFIYKKI